MAFAKKYETITGIRIRNQMTALLIALGHGSTHWLVAAFYMLLPWIREDLNASYLIAGTLVAITHLSSMITNFCS